MGLLARMGSWVGLAPVADVRSAEARADAFESTMIRMRQIAASGVAITMGHFDYELNQRLKGAKRWEALESMQNDPHVKGALRFNTLPLEAAEWQIVPASDKARDVDIAEFVSANLLGRPTERYGSEYRMRTSWRQNLHERLQMLSDGFSMFAKKFRRVGTRTVIDRLTWMEPSSVDPFGWQLDDEDNIVAIRRTLRLPSGRVELQKPISADQIVLCVHDLKGARYEGAPFTRSMWGAYYRKDQMLRWATIYAQRTGAPTPWGVYPSDWGATTVQVFQDYLEQLRGTAPTEGLGMFPRGNDGTSPEIKFAGADVGELDRMRSMINGENAEIAHAGGTKSMLLGETATGAKAVAEPISQIEIMFLGALATAISEFANIGVANLPGEIETLCKENFTDLREYPQLVCPRVHPSQGLDQMEGVWKGIAAKVIPIVPELRKQITERYGFKLPDDAYEIELVNEPEPQPTGTEQDDDTGQDDPSEDQVAAISASVTDARSRIQPLMQPAIAGKSRPNKLEAAYVNVPAVQKSFATGEAVATSVLRAARGAMTEEIVRRILTGKMDARSLATQRLSKFRGSAQFVSDMQRALRQVASEGRTQATDELQRMRAQSRAVA